VRNIIIYLLRIYQKLALVGYKSPCRFTPTCSDYAIGAIEKYGAIKGLFLAIKRLIRCNQWYKGGDDPVC
jgi:putative membrane protein insertion efficiency factor